MPSWGLWPPWQRPRATSAPGSPGSFQQGPSAAWPHAAAGLRAQFLISAASPPPDGHCPGLPGSPATTPVPWPAMSLQQAAPALASPVTNSQAVFGRLLILVFLTHTGQVTFWDSIEDKQLLCTKCTSRSAARRSCSTFVDCRLVFTLKPVPVSCDHLDNYSVLILIGAKGTHEENRM